MEIEYKRKMFLDSLPKWDNDAYKGKINWRKSAGHKVHFIFDNIEGEIEIIKFINKAHLLIIKYNDKEFKLNYCMFKQCKINKLLNIKDKIKFNIELKTKFKDKRRNITIIDRIYIKDIGRTYKYYKYKCNKCRFEGWLTEIQLLIKKQGYSCCNDTMKF